MISQSAQDILWHGYCRLAHHQAPMELQTHMLAIYEATRANGGRMPDWAKPGGAPHAEKTEPIKEDENE